MKRIIVCIKPVPDPKYWAQLKIDPETKILIREGIPTILNPLDKHALEAALQIKEKTEAEICLVSMAPSSAVMVLREALAMGADRAFLLSDRSFSGADTLATARVLSAGIRQIGHFDAIFCGDFSLDGSTAQVPSQVAELLNIASVCHVEAIKCCEEDNTFWVTQKIEHGDVTLRATPPILLAVTKEINRPRHISFLEIIEADEKEIRILDNSVLRLEPKTIGISGSPTQMADLILRKGQREGRIITGSLTEIVQQLTERLTQLGIL
ncbi:MAG: electron transfer flavoprotein subunit beta/FixA family protein [Deltaproteobacteria bacterium]|nr:electron transfer flavoprotein subunit beta/FixA family protein [Deltaproteobacteria bacterium]